MEGGCALYCGLGRWQIIVGYHSLYKIGYCSIHTQSPYWIEREGGRERECLILMMSNTVLHRSSLMAVGGTCGITVETCFTIFSI